MTTGHILLVDDEPSLVAALLPALTAAGHHVTVAADGDEAIAGVQVGQPDVVLLDLGLPDMDGKDVIKTIRESNAVPIIVLSARHQESEKIAALDEGADDYVDKPYEVGELLARIRSAIRRGVTRRNSPQFVETDQLAIDHATREVRLMGEIVKLSPKEFNLLWTLAESAGQVVTHRRLLAAGWGRSKADQQYLRVYMGLLRQKLEENPSEPTLILTEPGVGYRLVLNNPV